MLRAAEDGKRVSAKEVGRILIRGQVGLIKISLYFWISLKGRREKGRKGKIDEDAHLKNTRQPSRIWANQRKKYPSFNSTCPDMVIWTETFPSSGVDLEEWKAPKSRRHCVDGRSQRNDQRGISSWREKLSERWLFIWTCVGDVIFYLRFIISG